MGSFQWLYESDRMRTRKLKKYLNRLKEKTGLYDHLKVSFPEKRNLGYIRAEFSLDIGPKGLTKLISLSQREVIGVRLFQKFKCPLESLVFSKRFGGYPLRNLSKNETKEKLSKTPKKRNS